ncbi:MAG: hypothetical protein HYW04_03755 [Deltaproteobacteria bacterium]|nr:hypothetical protein [Deltaproteobacteria bacterium]
MAEKPPLFSEGEELDSFLAELESAGEVREIAGLESGFPNLSRALNGIRPGLYLLIGPPSCGKSAFLRQLCDQVAARNLVPALFFSFTESKKDLRVRTLARLSGVEGDEILRGGGFLLHRYGVPKKRGYSPEQMPPSWEKVREVAEEAKGWLDLVYLSEVIGKADVKEIESRIRAVRKAKASERMMVAVDDSQRLGPSDLALDSRLPFVAERLQGLAADLKLPLLATWPDLRKDRSAPELAPQAWAEKVAGADVILVMEEDAERTKKLTEPSRAIDLHIVKNRGGERSKLCFDFMPAFSKFVEATLDSTA